MGKLFRFVVGLFTAVYDFVLGRDEDAGAKEQIDENVEKFIAQIKPDIDEILQDQNLRAMRSLTEHLISDVRDYSSVVVKCFTTLDQIVKAAEDRGIIDGLTGPEKKEYCIRIVLRIIEKNDVELKWVPRFLEPAVLRTILGIMIDSIVNLLNRNRIFQHRSAA
jgi:hypothetical protein